EGEDFPHFALLDDRVRDKGWQSIVETLQSPSCQIGSFTVARAYRDRRELKVACEANRARMTTEWHELLRIERLLHNGNSLLFSLLPRDVVWIVRCFVRGRMVERSVVPCGSWMGDDR